MRYRFAIICLLASFTTTGQDTRTNRNALEYDSLVSVIKLDTTIIGLVREFESTDELSKKLLQDALKMKFSEIVYKYQLTPENQDRFLETLNMTALMTEGMIELTEEGEFHEEQYEGSEWLYISKDEVFSSLDSMRMLENCMDSIWNSSRVKSYLATVAANSDGPSKFKLLEQEMGDYIQLQLVEDNGLTQVPHLTFRVFPDEHWKIMYVDFMNDSLQDFGSWNAKAP